MKNKIILSYLLHSICVAAVVIFFLFYLLAVDAVFQQRKSEADLHAQIDELQILLHNNEARVRELKDLNSVLRDELSDLNVMYEQSQQQVADLHDQLSVYDNDLVVTPAPPRYFDVPLDEDLQNYIWSLCCAYGIEDNYAIVYAVIKKESSFNPSCISSTNDYGLMQINVCNHAWLSAELGIVDFLDPYENVHAGVYMLSSLIHKYEDNLADALMAYNMGEGGAGKLWRRGVHTTDYTERVLDYYKQFTGNI